MLADDAFGASRGSDKWPGAQLERGVKGVLAPPPPFKDPLNRGVEGGPQTSSCCPAIFCHCLCYDDITVVLEF